MKFPPPLRISITSVLVILGLLFVVCEYLVLLNENLSRVEEEVLDLASRQAARLAGFATRAANDERPEAIVEGLKSEFAIMAEDTDLKYALVCDSRNHVIAATRPEWISRPVSSTAAEDSLDTAKDARRSGQPQRRVLRRRDLAVAAQPVGVGTSRTAPSVVIVERDLSMVDAVAAKNARRDTLLTASIAIAAGGALWLALAGLLLRRSGRTLQFANGLLKNNAVPPPLLEGGDEFAGITHALHATHQRLLGQSRLINDQDERYRLLVEAVPVMVLAVRDDRVEFVNGAGLQMLGATERDQVLGRSPFDLIHADSQTQAREQVRAALRSGGGTQAAELRVNRLDGTALDVEGSVSSFRDERGVAVQMVMRDISEHKVREATRLALSRDLQEKNKELEAIVYAASHDLRSPLLNVMGFSRQLGTACRQMEGFVINGSQGPHMIDSAPLEPILRNTVPRALRFIEQGVTKMDALLTGFLRFSRVGRQEMDVHELDMDGMLRNITGAMTFQLQQAGAELRVGPLPACKGDSMQINQVFTNLLDNALKYRKPDRPCVINVEGRVENGRAVYTVTDNGIGIAPEHQHKIFEIFHRLDPNASSGEGLGLTIAQRIVQRHEGTITVDSLPGVGSTFTITLSAAE